MDSKSIQQKIIVIVGPTASGKSSLGIKLAKKFNGEIISADSRQVYRGMDIGTGKVTAGEQKIVKHYLLDVTSPKRQFTASDFKRLGEKAIERITSAGKIPIVVGGTGLYIDVLLNRMIIPEVPPNPKLRAQLSRYALRKAQLAYRGSSIYHKNSKGIFDKSGRNLEAKFLFELLQKLDPRRAETIDRHNKRRLIRALEIVITTGDPTPSYPSLNTRYLMLNTPHQVLWLGINPSKIILSKRIKTRLDERLGQGMINEVRRLHNPPTRRGVSWKRLDDFGLEYRWISRWLREHKDNSKFKDSDEYQNLLQDIIRYSKRQMTWFKRNEEIRWIKGNKNAEILARRFLD